MENLIIVRGAGDLATAVINKLHKCGFKVLALEIEKPLAIRRKVAFSEAVYDGEIEVEDVYCKLCRDMNDIEKTLSEGKVALVVDERGEYIGKLRPKVVVDCILAKRNLGTNKDMADLTIALGPGFYATKDADIVIETMRGHNLGRIIENGEAAKNTGIPGSIQGVSKERVVYSQSAGVVENICEIGQVVKKGQVICYIKDENNKKHEVVASIDGLLRGLIRDGAIIKSGLKILDIDPRLEEAANSFTISDKGRTIAGGVLEVIISKGILPKFTK